MLSEKKASGKVARALGPCLPTCLCINQQIQQLPSVVCCVLSIIFHHSPKQKNTDSLSQWLNFKLSGITCLGKKKFKLLSQGPLAE